MASEVKLPEPLEEKKASHEVIDLQAINKFVGTQNIKEQLEIKSSVVDENIVNEDVDLVKEDITEKPETLEEELKEKEEQKHEDAPSPIAETSTEEQEKINGEIENGVHSNQFTEELLPEVLRADEIPANGTSSSSEEIQEKSDKELSNVEKIDSEEVSKEDAPQSQIPENAEDDKDVIQSDTATLSDKDCHKEAEIPVGDEKQDAEECVTAEVEIPSATTPPVIEEVSAEAEGKNDILEEVEQEQIHQNEVAKENLAEEKDCRDETEDKSRGVSETLTAEETIPEEASRENQAPEMTSEETAKNVETSAEAETDETGPTDNEETTPHEDSSSNSNDFPITNEENRKGNEETTHLAEEDKGSAEINEEIKEEAQQNQIAEGYEIDMEASQCTPGTDLSESEHQNETEKEIENASADPEEQNTDTVDSKEVESTSVSEEVSKEEKESVAEEVQNEQAADETCAEEECPPDAGIQNTDPVELVVSGETMPEEAFPESKTPDPEMQISEEVKPTEDSIGVTEKDETSENDKEEDATEVPRKPDEYSEHISNESAVENAVSRDVTPEIETTDAEKTVTAETDNMDVTKIENEDEEKNSEQVEPSESSPAPIKIEEATPNDCEEEKQGDDKIEHIETNDEQEIESCLETEEKLEESKPSTSGEELSSARETIETEPIEEKADEENVAQDEITLDSKETVGNDDQVANCDEKGDETREINSAGEHNTNDGIKEDEEANKENVEEIPEPTKPSDGTEESTTAEVPREAIQPETENDVPSELTKGEEVLPETVSEGTVLSEMETEKIEDKVNDSERDDTEAGSSHVTNELKEDERNNTDEPDEMVQNFEVDEEPEEILSGNTVNETTPSIQNEEDPPEKDENINNETTEEEHITEVEASTVVTEVPAEEAQNSTAERSYDIDQLIPETASEQDNLPIASVGSETEAEKPETSDASSQGEVADSVIPETEDKSELEVEPKEKTDDEVTQKVEEVEELCVISHGTEELPEEDSTTVHEETSIEPNNSNVQQDLQTEESDANPTEAYNATDDISVEEGSEATTTLISSVEQTDERSIDTKGTASIQEESNVQAPNEEAKIAEELEESTEQINECTDPSNVAEVELRQSETVAPETEILEVTPSEKLEDGSNPTDIDAKSAESENTAEKPTEQDEVSSKPSNTRELQIDQTEFTAEQDQISEESEVKPTEPDQATEDVPTVDNSEVDATVSESVSEVENPEVIGESSASVDQIEDISVDKEESVVLQEDAAIAEEERQEIEPENEKHIKEVAEEESTIVHEETLIEPSISTIQQDLQTEESDANPIEPQNAADDISVEEGSEVNSTVLSSVEQTDDRSIDTEGTASIQEENNVQAPNEEADIAEELEESTEQIDHCIDPSNVAEVTPNTETLEVTPSQKLEDESNPTDIDAKLAESENTAEKSTEQEVPTKPSNTRELQIDQTEFTAEQDQPSEESEVKPTESDQAAEDAPTVENSEVDAAVSGSVLEVENSEFIGESGASVEQIEDVSVDKEESVVLQEEDAAVPEEEILEIEAEDEKHIEEDLQVTTPSEVTEVELNQTETVPPESEILEAVSNEVLGDDNKLVGTDINLAESESVTEEPAGEKEIPTEPNNARELQVGQAEIIVEQDQTSQESEGKPTELDQAIDVPTVENSTIDAAASESVEEIVRSLVVKEKSVLQDVATEMPEEEATNEKQIEEEVSQITNPSEVSEVELKESETLEAILNEGIDDESKPTGLDTKLAESESAVEEPSDEKEIPTEPNNARELQVDQAEQDQPVDQADVIVEQDELSQESEVKPTELDQTREEVSTVENSEVDATVSERVEEIGEGVAAEMPEEEATKEKQIEEEVSQITNQSEYSEVKLNQSETVPPETEILEAIPHDLDVVSSEELGDDNKLHGTDIKLVEFESTTEEPSEEKEVTTEPNNARELQVDQDDVIAEQDESSQELEVKPTELDQTKEEVPTMENLEVDAAVSESAEEIVESSVVKEKSVVLQEDVAVEMPEEEATDEKQIEEEVPQITDPSEVSEVELNQSEPVSAETEILKTDKNEELGDENKLAGTDINLAEFENATEEPSEEKDIPTEFGSTRELQANQTEIIAEQDELDQKSDVKSSESDLGTNELSLLENSEVAAAVSECVEGIGEDSSAKEECTILQVEAGTENQIEEEVPQITDPSEVSKVALNQSEPVPAETEILKTDKNEELGDENKLAGTDINLVKSEDTSVPTEDKEVSTEPNDTRELQIDQSEVTAEQDEPSQESDVKPTEPDQTTEQVSAVEKSDIVDDTVTATVEESKEEKCLIFEEEDVAVEMPVEEATNEKEIKPEVTEVVHPSEITEEQLAVTENELKSDQMENYLPEGLTEEKLDAGVSSGVEQIHEKSEESEVLCGSTGEQVEGEETDAGMIKEGTDQGVEAAEEEQPCEKHIEGEIHITSNPETNNATEEGVKAELTEKEVDPQVFKHQVESLEQEKVTEESASAEEKSEAGTTLVPGEMQTEETKSGILSQSVAESVTVPEEKISQEIEKNEEEIPTTADSEICDSVEVESNTVLNEKELDTLVCEAQPESPEKERETEESALPVENSIATAPSIPDEGQIEETEIANKEDGVLVQTMPESIIQPEEISQEVEANEEFSDKHIAEEIPRTADPAEVSYTAEEPKVILTEEDADSQKLGTETELPEQEETTEESTLMEEKSNATASSLPGDEPQSTAELVAVPEEIVSQEAEASEESSDQVVTGESMIVSNEEEVHSDKVITEIESPDLVTAAEELAEEKPAVAGNVVPGEGQVEEREIANKESCVAPETEGTVESVTIPEEGIPQGIETDDEPTDKHIVGEEDKVEQAQITTSLVEQPDSKNSGTELESALVEKTNGEIDMKANIDEAGLTSFEGAIINQTDNESETVPVVEQIHAEDEEPKGHTERDIDATVFLKTPEIAAYETNEHTEDAVPNVSEQNKEVEEEANQSEEPEQGFASIVSSFLINKVLSEENQTIDDATEQNNAASVIPKTSDDEMIQEVTKTKNEPETRDEDVPYATSSTEDLKPKQEQEEESAVKEVREDEQVDGVEQDYLPVSRFLMDKILRQEETKYPEKEAETIEEPDKHVISDGGIQVQEEFEESSTLVVAPPEKNADPPSSYSEMARDLETGKTLMISEVENTSITDGAISSEEKIENTISVEKLPKQGEGNHSPKEVAGDLEKVEKPADEALVSDVGSPSVEVSKGEIGSVGSVAEQEGERSISPAEAMRDFDKEDARIEPKNEGIPIDDKVEEITGEKILYTVQVGEYQHEKPAEEKDETLDSKVTYFTEAVEDLACGEDSKDLVEETVVNAPEISEPQKIMEESETTVMQKEEEHKDEAVAEEETPKDVKNVEENYVFVEHEVNQPEETKEVLEEKVTDEVGDVAISNLEEKQTALSAEIPDKKRDMADSTENCPKVEQSLPDVPEVPMVTEIVKEHVGNEADIIHGEEQVKEVTGTVESFENKSQEKASEMEAAKMEKKSEEIEDEEQEEDEEEEESHQEIREAEITGGDPTVKSEAKETETKSAQKKSLNILSGVGLKVITFTKVKKAFTGKSFTKVKKAFTGKSKSLSPSAK